MNILILNYGLEFQVYMNSNDKKHKINYYSLDYLKKVKKN